MDNKREIGVRKGAWTKEEDILLTKCIQQFGEGRWHLVPLRAGLNRCRKSCRMRWLNYLQPSLKRGSFGEDEVDLIKRMHKLLGNRWTLIAKRIPGRTSNDVKNFWNSHICKKLPSNKNKIVKEIIANKVIKPQPRRLTMSTRLEFLNSPINDQVNGKNNINVDEDEGVNDNLHLNEEDKDEGIDEWWRSLLQMSENGEEIIIHECLV